MRIEIDTTTDKAPEYRAAAAALLILAGDITIPEELTSDDRATALAITEPSASDSISLAEIGAILSAPPAVPPLVATAPNTATAPASVPPVENRTASPVVTSTVVIDANTRLDKSGLPWDARIHQRSHNQKKDGTWKVIKNLDPVFVQAVVKELFAATQAYVALSSVPAANTVPPPPPPPSAVPVPPVPVAAPTAAPSGMFGQPSVPVPPVPAVGPVSSGSAFIDLVNRVTELNKAGRLKADKLNDLCKQAGVPNFGALNNMDAKVPEVGALIDAYLMTAAWGPGPILI